MQKNINFVFLQVANPLLKIRFQGVPLGVFAIFAHF